MARGERDPSTHRTPEQTRKHTATYQQTPKQKKYRRDLARERYRYKKKHGKDSLKGKDLGHEVAYGGNKRGGGGSKADNLTAVNRSDNRGHGTSPGGSAPSKRKYAKKSKRGSSALRKKRKA